MQRKIVILIFSMALTLFPRAQELSFSQDNYLQGKVIIKLKEAQSSELQLTEFLNKTGATGIKKMFPAHQPPPAKYNRKGQELADLSLIYEVNFPPSIQLQKMINSFKASGLVEYAVPHNLQKLLYTPNDTFLSKEYHLGLIKAYDAWDIWKGDTNTVIGITDTGIDPDHPDLQGNIAAGAWNVADNNGNLTSEWATAYHGDVVAGAAGAVTDNRKGIAGAGFKCRILPVKISHGSALVNTFQGIVYAADHGCKVINCSWGEVYPYNQFEQDVITYAVINKDALVIAAAGNEATERVYYPASYKYVLSVTATLQDDTRKSNASYGANIDITAPGESIFTTINTDFYDYHYKTYPRGYDITGGTSMAAPIVAGCAGLLRGYFPTYDALQIGEQLKVTSDNIYSIPANAPYRNKLGYGRVNLLRALTIDTLPSIAMIYDSLTNRTDKRFKPNDTILFYAKFVNYLHATKNAVCVISCTSPYVQVLDSVFQIGALNTYQQKNNFTSPFRIKVLSGAPVNAAVSILVKYTDGSYYGYDWEKLIINKAYADININKIGLTVTSCGRLGYNDISQQQGIGFKYNQKPMLYIGGLMLGTGANYVSDCVYGGTAGTLENDFNPVSFEVKVPGDVSDMEVKGVFNDNNAANKLNVSVTQKAYAFRNAPHDSYVITEYTIYNNSADTLKNLYAGIYNDFDIYISSNNSAGFDSANKLGYAFSNDNMQYAGLKLLTDDLPQCYNLNNGGSSGSVKIYDGFSGAEKFTTLSVKREGTVSNDDVSQTLSCGPYKLPPLGSLTLAYAFTGGNSKNELVENCTLAKQKYDSIVGQRDYTVEGYVRYDNASPGKALSNVSVSFRDSEGKIAGSATTDAAGYYKAGNIPYGNYNVIVTPGLAWGGGNPVDALLINRNFISIYTFKTPLRAIAANVNTDSFVNPVDALLVNRRFTGIITSFSKGNWVCDAGSIQLKSNMLYNIKCICFGDVDASY